LRIRILKIIPDLTGSGSEELLEMYEKCNDREKLSAVKAEVENVEQETEANMHSLLLMDRSLVTFFQIYFL